jgi:uncharacterized repeat protein (TIGR01451 family)
MTNLRLRGWLGAVLRLLAAATLAAGPAAPAGAAGAGRPGAVPRLVHAAPSTPAVTATKSDTLMGDADGDGLADPGDTLRYSVVVSNSGSSEALGVVFSDTLDANTALSGTLQASALARSDTYTATQGTALVVGAGSGVLANDFGLPAPSASSLAGAATARGGTVTLAADGGFTYNPPASYSGPDSFSYTASNGSGSDSGLVSLTVLAPPLAVNDAYTATLDTPLSVPAGSGVLDNDSVHGATISGYAATTSEGGAVTLNADGSFTYTPAAGFFSPPADTFTYTLENLLGTSTAVVSLTVELPGPPVAVSDAYTATVNTTLNVPAGSGVLDNDTVNAATITDYAATTAEGGSVTLNADGSFSYTPDTDYLSPPNDTFTYTLENLLGASTATVAITVYPPGPPLAVDDAYTTTVDTALELLPGASVLSNDTVNLATITSYQATSSQGGTVTLGPDGALAYVPPSGFVSLPADTFTYTLENTVGASTALVSVTVYPPAAPLAADDAYTTTVNTPLSVAAAGVLGNDALQYGAITDYAETTAEGGEVTLNADGSFVYTPTQDFVSPPNDTFTYTLENLLGASTATVRITVEPPGPPVAVDDTYTATANVPLTITAPGVLNNDTLNFGAIANYQATTSEGGEVALLADGSFVYTPTQDFLSPPADTFTYTLTNTVGASTAVVTITVEPPGAPSAVDDAYGATANTTLTVTAGSGVLANDTVNLATITDYAALTSRGGSVTLDASGAFTYTPPADSVSPPADTFTYTLTNTLGTSTAVVTITIAPPGAPAAAGDSYTTTVDTELNVAAPGVLGNDLVNFATISDYEANTSEGGSVVVAASGAFTYTPPAGVISPPTDTFTYTLSNALGDSTATATIFIYPAAPPVAADDLYTTTVNTDLVVPADGVLGNDTPNFGAITDYQGTTDLGGTVVLDASGAFTYTPPAETVRPPLDSFTYTLTNTLGSDTATVFLAIDPPGAPLAVNDAYTATASATVNVPAIGVLANDTVNYATITAYAAASARGGTVVLDAGGAFTYTAPAAVSPPDDTFTYTLSNALGESTAVVTIELFPPAAPVAVNDSYTATTNVTRTFAAPGVLGNDTLNFGTLTGFQATTSQGGSVVLAASGAFTYTPPTDFLSGPDDTFTYTVSNALGESTGLVSITVYPPPPDAVDDSYTATGHITITVAAPGVLANDMLNWSTITGAAATSAGGGNVALNADGSFTYQSGPGFEGTDTFTYTLANATASDTATVTVTVSDVIWFVDNTAAAGDGRLGSAYNSLASLQGADADEAGDVIFIYQGTGSYSGGLVLEDSQALIGQGVALGTALAGLGITPAPGSAALPGAGGLPTLANAAGNALTLASGNSARAVNLGSATAGASLSGTNFGMFTATAVAVGNPAGTAITLTNGTLNAPFQTVSSLGGANGVSLTGVAGALSAGAGTLQAASGATFYVSGGSVSVTWSGLLTQTNNAALVSVAGGHSGTLTFQTGTLSATNGTGLQFDNADGAYNFNGTTTLNGGDAGIDILNGSGGTFTFAAGTSVSNPSGPAFNLDSSNATVTYSGSLSDSNGLLVDINNHDAGTVTFQSGTFNSGGQGVRVRESNGGAVHFNNSAKTLSTGANAAVTLSNNTGSTINFANGGLDIDTTSGAGISATGGGTVNVSGTSNTINTTTGTAVTLSGVGGAQTFYSVSANGAANGIALTNTTGSFEVTGDGASDAANTTRGRTTARQGGGTIALGSGGTLAGTTGAAVLLSNAANVTLRNMTLSTAAGGVNDGRDGVRASGGSGLTLDNVRMDGNGNGLANNSGLEASGLAGLTLVHSEVLRTATAAGVESSDVWAVDLTNVSGGAAVSHSIFDTARENVFGLVQSGSTTLSLAVTNVLFQNANIAGVGNNGLGIAASNTANVSVAVTGSEFRHFWGNGFQYVGVDQSGGGLIEIENSLFDDDGSSINIAHQGQGQTLRFNLQNNQIRATGAAPGAPGNALNAINVLLGEPASAGSVLEGYITGNTLGSALAHSGSAQGNGIRLANFGPGTLTVAASNNAIQQVQQDHAFWAFAGKQTAGTNVGTINLTLSGSDFRTGTGGLALAGLGITAGTGAFAGDSPTICADVRGNTRFSGEATYFGIDLTMSGTSPTVRLPGYGGAVNDDAAVEAFLNSATVAGTVSPAAGVFRSAGTLQGVASCPAPGFAQGSLQGPDRQMATGVGRHGLARWMSPAQQARRAQAAADTVQATVGTLPAGKAVTFTFDVVIADPVPAGTTQVSNQATITGDNFAAVLSDDPATAAANDPTVTMLDAPQAFPLYLPLVGRLQSAPSAAPDLVGSFSLSPAQSSYAPGQPVTITVVVTNVGTAPASPFWVDFYINPSSPPAQANQTWESLCALTPCYGLAWGVEATLAPGESVTLTSTPGSYWAPNTVWPGSFAPGTSDLYLYVDSYSTGGEASGAVPESEEGNNRTELHFVASGE